MLFTFEISNPAFWTPWHLRTPHGHSVGWLWFALSGYVIPPGTQTLVAQRVNQRNLEEGKADVYAAIIFGCLALIALLLMFLLSYQSVDAQALSCSYESSGQFVMITETDPQLDVTVEQLGAIDLYFRDIYGDDERDHVWIPFDDNQDFENYLPHWADGWNGGWERWSVYSGLQIPRRRWEWESCSVDQASDVKVDLVFTRVFPDDATMFGLIVHELSHASGVPDGDGTGDDASAWERIANHAFNDTCDNGLQPYQSVQCKALRILLGA